MVKNNALSNKHYKYSIRCLILTITIIELAHGFPVPPQAPAQSMELPPFLQYIEKGNPKIQSPYDEEISTSNSKYFVINNCRRKFYIFYNHSASIFVLGLIHSCYCYQLSEGCLTEGSYMEAVVQVNNTNEAAVDRTSEIALVPPTKC